MFFFWCRFHYNLFQAHLIVVVLYSVCVEFHILCCILIPLLGSVNLLSLTYATWWMLWCKPTFTPMNVNIFMVQLTVMWQSKPRHVSLLFKSADLCECLDFLSDWKLSPLGTQTDRTGYSTGGSEMERETESPQRPPEAHQHSSTIKAPIGRF